MTDDPQAQETREVILRCLRLACGGELPAWLPDEAATDAYVNHVTAVLDSVPPRTESQLRRVGNLLRPLAATAASGARG
jgi:hypothetical protein